MSQDRRGFLKIFGLTSAGVIGASGGVEKIEDNSNPPVPPTPLTGEQQWKERQRMSVVTQVLYDRMVVTNIDPLEKISPYSREKVGHLRQQYTFFSEGLNHTRGTEETNVYSARRLDPPEIFKMDKLGITFAAGTNVSDRNAIINSYALKFWIGNKYFVSAPLVEAFGVGSDPTVEFKTLYHLDIPLIWDQHSFHLCLESQNPPEISGPVMLFGVLHGQKARGVQ